MQNDRATAETTGVIAMAQYTNGSVRKKKGSVSSSAEEDPGHETVLVQSFPNAKNRGYYKPLNP